MNSRVKLPASDIVISLNTGVMTLPEPGAVVVRFIFLKGAERLYVFAADRAFDLADLIGATLKRRAHQDNPQQTEDAARIFMEERPQIGDKDITHIDPETVVQDIYTDEWSDGMVLRFTCVNGSHSMIVLGNVPLKGLMVMLEEGIQRGGFVRSKHAIIN
jgi:hypothetical protein